MMRALPVLAMLAGALCAAPAMAADKPMPHKTMTKKATPPKVDANSLNDMSLKMAQQGQSASGPLVPAK
jgi:hypothetical protein